MFNYIRNYFVTLLSNSNLFDKYIEDAQRYIDLVKSKHYNKFNCNKTCQWLLNMKRFNHLPTNFKKNIIIKYNNNKYNI